MTKSALVGSLQHIYVSTYKLKNEKKNLSIILSSIRNKARTQAPLAMPPTSHEPTSAT